MSLDHLREEFLDFTLSPSDLPTPGEYLAADGAMKPEACLFLGRSMETKNFRL